VGKSVLKELSFELRFDDPRLPEQDRIVIKGNQKQLEALYTVVTNYVQQFLQKSPETFWTSLIPKDSIQSSDTLPPDINYSPPRTFNSFNAQTPGTDIRIEPSGHLTHNLFFGSLQTSASTPSVPLSLLQLFDLATALDEYSSDVIALPNIETRRPSRTPTWAPIAAVLALAVGLAPLTWQYSRQRQQVTATKTTTQQKIALNSSPTAPSAIPTPLLTPSDNVILPTPLATTLPQPTGALPGVPPVTIPGVPTTATSPSITFPSASQTSPNPNITSTLPTAGNTLTIPGGAKAPTLSGNSKGAQLPTLPGAITIQPNSRQTNPTSVAKGKNTTPQLGIPSSTSITSNNFPTSTSPVIPPLAGLPNDPLSTQNFPATAPIPPIDTTALNPQSATSDNNSLNARLRQGRNTPKNSSAEVATGTLFDNSPQISQARDYLKKRWQPPAGLKQTLEYSLLIGVDGSIERIFPLGGAARNYFDSTGMPSAGQPFVSPSKNGQPVRIRAVLTPDGKVQTFPETE
jgi:hypothetical protein